MKISSTRYRTHTCGQLRELNVNEIVRLSGWVHRLRDHGGVIFADLRDDFGITQIVIDPKSEDFSIATALRSEWVITVDGRVQQRPVGTKKTEILTGDVEVVVTKLQIISEAKELPLPVFGEPAAPEEMRLQYRFLDLRRASLHRNIKLRNDVISSMRRRMHEMGFSEFQTPILTASSPEGARDFLVPSRQHPGKFYALPQAPQQFKQLVMMSGFDRYFQIAPCFRDEDARADRSPGEFYQLDIEMSFVEQEDIFSIVEPMIRDIFEEFGGGRIVTKKFPRITFEESIRKYGSDKPDLRNPIVIENVSSSFANSDFHLFANIIDADPENQVWAIPAPKGANRAFCDRMDQWARSEGQPGLAYIMWRNDGLASGPVAKAVGQSVAASLQLYLGLGPGDAAFFIAGDPKKFHKFAGGVRQKVGQELSLIKENQFEFCWIVDFPMFEWNDEENRVDFSHNPFSMPQGGISALKAAKTTEEKLNIKAYQYDIVCNGIELSSGAIRNHLPEVMYEAFSIAGYGSEILEKKFGGMLKALQYGAPPHGGIAPGIDRIVMLLANAENLRDVIMFPMNQKAQDLLMGAPSEVSAEQLRELQILTKKQE